MTADATQTRTATSTADASAGLESACYLCLALEAGRPLASGWRRPLAPGVRVSIGRERRADVRSEAPDLLRVGVADQWMSGRHAALAWQDGDWVLEDAGSKNGTRVNGARIDRVTLRDGDVLQVGNTFFVYREAKLDDTVAIELPPELATLSPALERTFWQLTRVARTDLSVMLHGASGTGKEVAARALHAMSGRSGQFVAVNCGAIPRELLQSELFGHTRGAFSGADEARPGLVRAAHQGTLFLDEVAELSGEAQVALLRVLQEREVRAVGGQTVTPVDIRVVTATHADLGALIDNGRFRADLYARLAGLSVDLLPLSARVEDLGLLIARLLRRIAGDGAESLQLRGEAAAALFLHRWPLNVRELEQALRLAVSLADGGELTLAQLPASIGRVEVPREREPVKDVHADELRRLLVEHKGNVSAIARSMNTSRPRVRRLAARLGLDIDRFRDP